MLIAEAIGPVGRGGEDEPKPFGMISRGGTTDLRRQFSERLDPPDPLGHARRSQLVEHREVGLVVGAIEAMPALGDAIAQHGGERALLDLDRIDLRMGKFEMLADALG
jgi:hypothetical protein